MKIGIPAEIKNHEHRVGATPSLVEEIVMRGHRALVESQAGVDSGFSNDDYELVGATIMPSPEKLYGKSDVILKIQEPMPVEYELIRPEHIVFATFHFPGNLEMCRSMMARGCTCFAYDLFKRGDGVRPLFDLEGRLNGQIAVLESASLLQMEKSGRGMLLSGAIGAPPAQVVVIGTAAAALSAALFAAGIGAAVHLLVDPLDPVEAVQEKLGPAVVCHTASTDELATLFPEADLVIAATGSVDPQTTTPVTTKTMKLLRENTVLVDLDARYGGSIPGSKPTSADNPTFKSKGLVYFCPQNLPGLYPRTASAAHSNALLPHMLRALGGDAMSLLKGDGELSSGTALYEGRVSNKKLAGMLGVTFYPLHDATAADT